MQISVYNNGKTADIAEVAVSRNRNIIMYSIYTKDLNPFGELQTQGQYCFWLSHSDKDNIPRTIIKFMPYTDEDRVLMRNEILLTPGKLYLPERKVSEGQWCQRIYCVTPPDRETEQPLQFTNLKT